jgi:hypothetical protein
VNRVAPAKRSRRALTGTKRIPKIFEVLERGLPALPSCTS